MRASEERFWANVEKTDSCWLWLAGRSSGYGKLIVNGRHDRAHRYSWQLHYGLISDGLHVLHRCDVKLCVNPLHLFLGTHADNMRDWGKKRLAPSGDNHWSKRLPGSVPRGEKHYFRQHPGRAVRGERHGQAKLKTDQVQKIRHDYLTGRYSQKVLADTHGVSPSSISRIVNGRGWR